MSRKTPVLRIAAQQDIDAALDRYAREAPVGIAAGFKAVRAAGLYRRSSCRRLQRYPYLVFYVARDDFVDIWRVLHAGRDIPAWMNEPET